MEPTNITIQRRTLGGLLRLFEAAMRAEVYNSMAKMGFSDIRPAHSAVFRTISADGSRVSELAERAEMTKQSMAYLTDNLEALGYVIAEPDPSDGRAKRVRLTARGRAAWEALVQLSAEAEAGFAAKIGAGEMKQLRTTLERLADVLTARG
jgi:DNA-binding MarR family transcriptional regulator